MLKILGSLATEASKQSSGGSWEGGAYVYIYIHIDIYIYISIYRMYVHIYQISNFSDGTSADMPAAPQ